MLAMCKYYIHSGRLLFCCLSNVIDVGPSSSQRLVFCCDFEVIIVTVYCITIFGWSSRQIHVCQSDECETWLFFSNLKLNERVNVFLYLTAHNMYRCITIFFK